MTLVQQYEAKFKPRHVDRLAFEAALERRTAAKLFKGQPLGQSGTRQRAAAVLGVDEDDLFPIREGRKKSA